MVFKRASGRSVGRVCHQPWSMPLRRPSLSWTIPYPQAAVPGSMPNTFTEPGYGRLRMFLLRGRSLQHVLGDVEVRVNLLHVVVVLECIDHPDQLLRLALVLDRDRVLGEHR